MQAVGIGSAGCRAGLSYMAGRSRRGRANERERTLPVGSARSLANVLVRCRATSQEVLARLLRLIVRQNPGRVLRLGRTRERLAKVRAYELPTDPEFVRERFGSNGVRPVCPSLRSIASSTNYTRTNERVNSDRTIVTKSLQIEHMFAPPCHPAKEVFRALLVRPGAERAGRLFFLHFRGLVGGFV